MPNNVLYMYSTILHHFFFSSQGRVITVSQTFKELEENMSLPPPSLDCPPFMHLYLLGAESRDFGSIIAGWVAADRKKRPICWSRSAAADCGGRESSRAPSLLFNVNNRPLSERLNPTLSNTTWNGQTYKEGWTEKNHDQLHDFHHNNSLCEASNVDTVSMVTPAGCCWIVSDVYCQFLTLKERRHCASHFTLQASRGQHIYGKLGG